MKSKHNFRRLLGGVPRMTGHKPRKRRRRFKAYFIWCLIFTLIFLGYRYVESEMMPTILMLSEMRIQTVSNEIISSTVSEVLKEYNVHTEDLSTCYYNESGELTSFNINTVLINQMSASVMEKIAVKIRNYDGDALYIPLGKIVGSKLFSNVGPKIKILIFPYGTTSIRYDSAFVSEGINQINHRIWFDVDMTMQVIAPLNKSQAKTTQTVTLVDRIINGHVPDQYINVPKDDVLNVAK